MEHLPMRAIVPGGGRHQLDLGRSIHSPELTIRDVMAILRRRQKLIAFAVVSCFLLGVLVCLVMTPRYEARGILEIQKNDADMLGIQNMMSGPEGPGDALNANLDLQTKTEILKSDTLALKVIQDLNLENTADFKPKWSPMSLITRFLPSSDSGEADPQNSTLDNSPVRRARDLKIFSSHLKVEPVPGTRLIEIRYYHSNREVAAAVINDLIHALKDYGFQTRFAATRETSEWLNGQLADLKQQAQDSQSKVVMLQKDSGVFAVGTDAQGRDQVYSSTLDKLQQATTALMTATSSRIMKGAVYQNAKNGDPEMLSMLAGGGLVGSSAGVQNSLSLLQNLRQQQSTLQAQVAQDSSKFGEAYPKLADEKSSLAAINKAISEEVGRIGERASTDFKASQETEARLKAVYDQTKIDAERTNDKTIEYGIAKQEADDSRNLYEDLFKRLKSAGVIEGLRSSNIAVVEPGRVPAKPARPNIPLYLGLSVVSGVFLGLCGALFTDSVDTKIRSIEGTESLLGFPLIGVLPYFINPSRGFFGGREVASIDVLNAPEMAPSPYLEALRGLRTKILHSRSAGAPSKVILISSSLPDEGKSTTCANLAVLLARSGKRVLLVEADMRRPSFSFSGGFADSDRVRSMNYVLPPPSKAEPRPMQDYVPPTSAFTSKGVREYQREYCSELGALLNDSENRLQSLGIKMPSGVELLPAGPPNQYPSELLDSDRMRALIEEWRARFDYILLDSPPLLAVTDAMILSHYADMTLIVARPGFTTRKALTRSIELVERGNETRIGVILNGVDIRSVSYGEYYGSLKSHLSYINAGGKK
jgi:polysaccharide biosynthesis transport protein